MLKLERAASVWYMRNRAGHTLLLRRGLRGLLAGGTADLQQEEEKVRMGRIWGGRRRANPSLHAPWASTHQKRTQHRTWVYTCTPIIIATEIEVSM